MDLLGKLTAHGSLSQLTPETFCKFLSLPLNWGVGYKFNWENYAELEDFGNGVRTMSFDQWLTLRFKCSNALRHCLHLVQPIRLCLCFESRKDI